VPKILKSSSREMRPILKSQPSERSIRSNQAEAEWVHAKVAKAKKDQVRSLLGLLELEIEVINILKEHLLIDIIEQ